MRFPFLSQLNPRRNLRARVGLAFGGSALVLALLLSVVVGELTRNRLERASGARLAELAYQTADKLDRQVFERYKDVSVLASLPAMRDPEVTVDERREVLERLQSSYPAYAWIGLTDSEGVILASTGRILEGASAAQRDPFIYGKDRVWVGDVHDAILLATLLPETEDGIIRFLDVAAPIHDLQGRLHGVLVAHPGWAWTREVQASLVKSAGEDEGIEMLILAADGTVLLQADGSMNPSAAVPLESVKAAQAGRVGAAIETWPNAEEYVTGYARSRGYQNYSGLGWIVLIRQRSDVALAPARDVQVAILSVALALGALFATIGWIAAGRILRPLHQLAVTAERVRHGERDLQLPDSHRDDDVSSLAGSVHEMISELSEREGQLRDLNQTLEDRVRERTREARTLALVARHTDNAVILTGAQHHIEWVNTGFTRLTGYTLEDAIGRLPGELLSVPTDDADGPAPTALVTPTSGERGYTIEHAWRTRAGDQRWVVVEYQPILGDDGTISNYALLGRDVSANRAAEEQLRHDALHDALTGLPNRALFTDRLSHAIRRARREPAPRFAVLFVDLDGFKKVNDTFGHAIGDLLLIGTARRLEACLRPSDTVARLGGDEMAVLLEAPGPIEEAQRVAERILEQLTRPFDLEGCRASVGASIGIAIGNDPGGTVDGVLRHADAAMYAAKHRGKGQWVLFDDLDEDLRKSA